jgi:hypothetical protein
MNFSATLTLMPGCSPWRLRPAPAISAAITDGGGAADAPQQVAEMSTSPMRKSMHEMEYSFTLPCFSSAIAVGHFYLPEGNQADYLSASGRRHGQLYRAQNIPIWSSRSG